MRKLFVFPAVLLGILVVFQSCSKQSPAEAVAPASTNIVNATIAPNGTYQLPIDNSGTVAVSISRQASHFQVSETGLDSKTGFTVYTYVPVADYRGTDEVLLSSTRTSVVAGNGCGNSSSQNSDLTHTITSTSYTTVKINITN